MTSEAVARNWEASSKHESLPNNVGPAVIALTQYIEQEQVHIIEECLMVQEQLRQVAQVLTEQLLLLAVYLEHGDIGIPVDLIPRRMLYSAALEMLQHLLALLEEHEVILTEV